MYSQQSPHFQKKDVHTGTRDYRSPSPLNSAVNLRNSSSGSSITSPSKVRRLRSSPRSPKQIPETSPHHHLSTQSVDVVGLGGYDSGESPSYNSSSSKFFATSLQGRSSSMSNVGLMMREHSLERRKKQRDRYTGGSYGSDYSHSVSARDRSLDREIERFQNSRERTSEASVGGGYNSNYNSLGRDRSHERDYPLMGARSLERGEHTNLHRSRSIDHEYILNQSTYYPDQPEYIHTRETLILDFQSQIADLNKECAILQKSVDTTKEKLSSSMNSIKTFWSPELKKERQLRKEESAKLNSVAEQLRIHETEKTRLAKQIHQLESELKHQADLINHQQHNHSNNSVPPSPTHSHIHSPHGSDVAAIKKERQSKEIRLLRKTIEEMELRIETQKQTLDARDASIKKLLEMLQSKGLASKQWEEDKLEIDRWREKAIVEERRVFKLEVLMEQKEKEVMYLHQELLTEKSKRPTAAEIQSPDSNKRDTIHMLTIEAMLETKENKIKTLESELENVRTELEHIRNESGTSSLSTPSTPTRVTVTASSPSNEAWKSQEKLLKSKLDNLKAELNRKETELTSIQSRVTSAESQASDKEHLVAILKEQVASKEKQTSLLQADVDSLRQRMSEQESRLDNKSKQLISAQSGQKQHNTQVAELKDQVEIKTRCITVLDKKVDALEESLKEKTSELQSIGARLNTIQADHSTSDTTLNSLHESIEDKDTQIEKLKQQRDTIEKAHRTELDLQTKVTQDIKAKLNLLEGQVSGRQQEIAELKEDISVLKQERIHSESELKFEKEEKLRGVESINSLQLQLEQVKEQKKSESQGVVDSLEKQITSLKELVSRQEGEVSRTQNELDRLLDILKTTENEKNTKDDQIKELHDQIKELKSKVSGLKKTQQDEKTKSASILEEAVKRESDVNEDSSQIKQLIAQKQDRIEEMEEALRESVRITAQREMVVHELEVRVKHSDMQMKNMMDEMEGLREYAKECKEEVTQLRDRLEEKGDLLKELQSERNKHMLDVFDMKQEAILAAITEKDAHIALIEMTPNNTSSVTLQEVEGLTQEKQHLQRKLKDLTEQRMKILHAEEKNKSPRKSSLVSNGDSQDDDDKKGSIWT